MHPAPRSSVVCLALSPWILASPAHAQPCPPRFDASPASTLVIVGGTATLTAAASPAGGVAYSWRHGATTLADGPTASGSGIVGAHAASLTIVNATAEDAGFYWCQASSGCGSAESSPAYVAVNAGCGEVTDVIVAGASCTMAGQECGVPFEVTRDTCGIFRLEYITAPTHCSDVGMAFFLDGVPAAITPPVGPGVSTGVLDFGPLASGPHVVSMYAIGSEGGCNSGFIEAWAGTLLVTYCIAPPAISTQPASTATCGENPANVSIGLTGGGPPLILWQVNDPAAPGAWRVIYEGGNLGPSGALAFVADGSDTTQLRITPAPSFVQEWSGSTALLRCVAATACGEAVSDPATFSVIACCPADFNADGFVDPDDLSDYIACYFEVPSCPRAEINGDGFIDPDDLSDYIAIFFGGC